jgi:hypothetical protein
MVPAFLLVRRRRKRVLNAALGHDGGVSSVPRRPSGNGERCEHTRRYLASAIGLTVITLIVHYSRQDSGQASGIVSAWNIAVWLGVGISVPRRARGYRSFRERFE